MGLFDFLLRKKPSRPISNENHPQPRQVETDVAEKIKTNLFRNLREFNTDLVEASYIRCCCSECAKYRERVYSVSGRDRRFPKLPEFLLAGEHDCGIMLFPFIDGVNSMRTRKNKELLGAALIRHSNRPFVDDRTPDELRDLAEAAQNGYKIKP